MFKQYDIIQIRTTKRIRYLSAPPGMATDPHGNWSIVGFIKSDIIAAKENTLVRVPISDVTKVASLSSNLFYSQIANAGYLKTTKINMVPHIATTYGINVAKAKQLLVDHNFKLEVDSMQERDLIVKQLHKIRK